MLVSAQYEAPFAVTLENAYDGVATKIPDGLWHCSPTTFHKRGYATFEIHVPKRTRLLFHKGNIEEDSDGCILVAENFADFDPSPGIQRPAISNSSGGFGEFMRLAPGGGFFLKVTTV